eukprot:270543_1
MAKMKNQELRHIGRMVSGMNTFKVGDADKWSKEDMEDETNAMQQHLRRLSQHSLSLDQIQQESKGLIEQYKKQSMDEHDHDDDIDGMNGYDIINKNDLNEIRPITPINNINDELTFDVINNDDVDDDDKEENEYSVSKHSFHDEPLDINEINKNSKSSLSPKGNNKSKKIMKIDTAKIVDNRTNNIHSPIEEIKTVGTPHTMQSQAVMVTDTGSPQQRGRENSFSYHQRQQNAAYIIQPQPDISHVTGMYHQQPQHQQYQQQQPH